jgi:ATP diphosphatase
MADLTRLSAIMAALRDPDSGCPWDLQQDFSSIARHTIEEAYEVADAIASSDYPALADELGDLLFQVVFHSRLASEQGHFNLDRVIAAIEEKLIRRHPHVFAGQQAGSDEELNAQWERIKADERARAAAGEGSTAGALDGVPRALPSLLRALKLQKRAARVGFDWPDSSGVVDKLGEELDELRAELATGDRPRIAAELGDLLFTLVNLSRHLGVDPEESLGQANRRFESRFRSMERQLAAEGEEIGESSPERLDELWEEAKRREEKERGERG